MSRFLPSRSKEYVSGPGKPRKSLNSILTIFTARPRQCEQFRGNVGCEVRREADGSCRKLSRNPHAIEEGVRIPGGNLRLECLRLLRCRIAEVCEREVPPGKRVR